jgi:hypothetical protein
MKNNYQKATYHPANVLCFVNYARDTVCIRVGVYTVQEADSIMARVEYSYQQQVTHLQQEKHDLKVSVSKLTSSISL